MRHTLSHFLRRFQKNADGNASIEFVFMFPIFFLILLSSVELGIMTLRYTMLERALDLAVREVRLSTGAAPDHDELRQMICDDATMIPNCYDNLKLEMLLIDPRNWEPISSVVTCTNQAKEVQPVTTFVSGTDNELMLLRACIKFTPLFGDKGLGLKLAKDSNGDSALVAMSAFVQEPR